MRQINHLQKFLRQLDRTMINAFFFCLLLLLISGSVYAQCSYTAGIGCTLEITSPTSITGSDSWSGTVCVADEVIVESGGTLTINSGTNVAFDEDMSIVVEDGGSLVIYNSELYAQGGSGMWLGIIGQQGSSIYIDGSRIYHAYIGVESEGSSSGATYLTVTNGSCFVNNEIGIYMHSNTANLVHLIQDSEFSAPSLVSPKSGEVGDYGILVKGVSGADVGFFQIGNTSNYTGSSTYNYFHDIAIGIRAYEANLKVQNCQIRNMLNSSSDLPTGSPIDELSEYETGNIGILSSSNAASPNFERYLIVGLSILTGGALNNDIYTDATDGFIGIAAKTKVNTQIYSNRISGDDISDDFIMKEGVRIHEDQSDHDIQTNLISNFETHGIRSVNITGRTTLIQNNIITRSLNPSSSETTIGILVNASSTNQDLDILDNIIDHVETGIYIIEHDDAYVVGNIIEIDRGGTSAIGIDIASCEDVWIEGNYVEGNCNNTSCSGGTNNNIGIWAETCDGMFITKNYVENLTTGILIQGVNDTGNMTCNEIHDCLAGFGMLDVVVDGMSDDIGPIERSGIGPSDNSWYPASTANRERHLGGTTDLSELTWKYRNLDVDAISSLPNFDMPHSLLNPNPDFSPVAVDPFLMNVDEDLTCASPYRLTEDDLEFAIAELQNKFRNWLNRDTLLNATSEYIYRTYFYKTVLKTDGLSELLEDEFIDMFTTISESNIPVYFNVKTEIDNNLLDSIIEQLEAIEPQNEIESALSTVLLYIYNFRKDGLSPEISDEVYTILFDLATSDPKILGDAVFMARGLLDIIIHPSLDMGEAEKFGEFEKDISYSISPNPANEYISIHSSGTDDAPYLVTIHDLTNRCVLEIIGYKLGSFLNIQELTNGLYFVIVQKNNAIVFAEKFIITK